MREMEIASRRLLRRQTPRQLVLRASFIARASARIDGAQLTLHGLSPFDIRTFEMFRRAAAADSGVG